MPRIKIFLSLMIIVLAVALVGGATMAWFTAQAVTPENTFEAGTVKIKAGWEEGIGKIITENWNPGDCNDFKVCLENEGSKSIRLRAKFEGKWVPGDQRMLVIYKDNTVQLISLDWNSFCKGCTGKEGYIAKGKLHLAHPGSASYFTGTFIHFDYLKNEGWLKLDIPYHLWCVDATHQISTGNHDPVFVYDPYCNPGWWKEVNIVQNDLRANIPWHRLDYIINNFAVGVDGFTMDNIQDAIWYFTNPSTSSNPSQGKYYYYDGSHKEISTKAKEIVDAVLANADLELGNVDLNPGNDWQEGTDGWWYYKGEIAGTFASEGGNPVKICFPFRLCLDGGSTGNEYQGASYHLYTLFEAVQASNNASDNEWGMSFDGTNWTIVTTN